MKEFNFIKDYPGLLITTTARKSKSYSRLPDKWVEDQKIANILITDENILKKLLVVIDGEVKNIYIDVERKQDINLMKIALDTIKKSNLVPIKPNDLTLEAADQLILCLVGANISGKNIIVYGTGNIAFKLAVRLVEREANVYLEGRNKEKVSLLVNTINSIIPHYTKARVFSYNSECKKEMDGLISFLSSEKVIGEHYVDRIKSGGFAIDGGIGNLNEKFICKSLSKKIENYRLDVRFATPFLKANIEAKEYRRYFFKTIIGFKIINKVQVVSGGLIGNNGDIIVDKISNPEHVIGVANGYGGLKKENEITKTDAINLQIIEKSI